MTPYAFRCPACGPFTESLPMGSAPAALPCGSCGTSARRVFSASFSTAASPILAARAREEKCRDEPEVVLRCQGGASSCASASCCSAPLAGRSA
ncbi:MAG: zinc ribbon domain-containing protein [Actinomycetota bacterium]|nr:zinc ribbon domain-containing protein [Actinomycetota bacterium]